jgi:hypothetical protein
MKTATMILADSDRVDQAIRAKQHDFARALNALTLTGLTAFMYEYEHELMDDSNLERLIEHVKCLEVA